MVEVHHRCARAELGQVLDHLVAVVALGAAAPALLDDVVAEQLGLADQHEAGLEGDQALAQGRHRDACLDAVVADEVGEPVDGLRRYADTGEQFLERFAPTQ